MENLRQSFVRGLDFARNNPQILYTLFLVVAIPVAFFFTSEQFLKVATENQDRLERERVALLEDAFAEFLPEHITDSAYMNAKIAHIASENDTMSAMRVVEATTTQGEKKLVTVASLDPKETGTSYEADPLADILLKLSAADSSQSFAASYANLDGRFWRSVRSFTSTSSVDRYYVVTDISMAEADAVARKNIRDAYIVLLFIILLIIGLLARQARIIDYATLYKRLKDVDQMKDDFVSMAAHELRSPLTIIRGYVDLLGDGEGISETGKGHLKHIDQSAQQLNSLIGDILDVAKLQEGRMSFKYQTVDVSEHISSIVESFMKPAEDKGLKLSYEKKPLPSISVDTDRFRQIMINLVGNAIKYTPNGEVKVLADVVNDRLVIRVSDTGMGISAEDQQKLFQKFFRVKNEETERITGTGLGLWITATIVKTMKGTISVESIRGKGTDFILSFPLEK